MKTKNLLFLAAPMEGVCGFPWRNAHASCFPGTDFYYSPFLTATASRAFRKREIRDVLPENNGRLHLVPQIMASDPGDFIWAAREMSALGYPEVNLNLGCPSGTVVRKGRGAGFLRDPEALDDFFAEVFSAAGHGELSEIRISVKTRIGVADPSEGLRLIAVFNRYPISLLTIHPRTLRDGYKGPVHRDIFREMLRQSRNPVCYNGDLRAPEDVGSLLAAFPAEEYPQLTAVMAGRGLVSRPSLFSECRGGARAAREKLREFHREVLGNYRAVIPEEDNVLFKMKELWGMLGEEFPNGKKALKRIRKARRMDEYLAAVNELFSGD